MLRPYMLHAPLHAPLHALHVHTQPETKRPCVMPGSLGVIVRSFKSAVTKRINELRRTPGAPVWQRNYYERIIRNDRELSRIRQYIADNPMKWDLDRDNPAAVGTGAPGHNPLSVRVTHASPQPEIETMLDTRSKEAGYGW